ncbi:MAG: transposase, partial [Prevotella sp.]|nr:transposase [Prevotella sp.]
VSIDETCLSTGEVYTIASNKDAHGRKGCLIAVVKGTKAKDVIKALMKPEALRMSVEEVTLDFSECMHNIVETCFPKAMRTLDRFHHQQNPSMQRSSISEHNSEVLLTVSSFSSD